ncbi:hypothetical protein SAMN04515668_4446 [Hymenobacter arizonensis]|uniref:Uncharacterized protein n=1 Tax=Hymenobacter arizonensis TaxID=1227077 RepID=A0A1I6BF02_HYMAR|nr:hypothetical protein SAMN04515668_4446 [Hymenobacter arizonensis]
MARDNAIAGLPKDGKSPKVHMTKTFTVTLCKFT